MTWSPETIVVAAQQGDPAALAVLLEQSHPRVRRFAQSLCSTPQDAEDAAQEAMIILYQRIGSLRAVGALSSWMYRIIRNECIRRSRLLRHSELPMMAPELDAQAEVLRRLEAAHIAEVVAALPQDQRRVLVLRDLQGLSGREVSTALGMSLAAVKSHLHRARANVRKSFPQRDWSAKRD